MWKKGTSEEDPVIGVSPGSFATTPSTAQGTFAMAGVRTAGSALGEHLKLRITIYERKVSKHE